MTFTVAFGLLMVAGAGRLLYLVAKRAKMERTRRDWQALIARAHRNRTHTTHRGAR